MNYYTYIIQSESTKRLYIGQTNNIHNRLLQHNSDISPSTKNKGPWKILFAKGFESRTEAILLEKKLKSFKNKQRVLRWIELNAR
ncbi:MAG: GIY-YIG nuclease family protein [Ignavibacteria bacterium]|nr:GIY-YIG nuclease family protein [Ignavibacteria bacterium]